LAKYLGEGTKPERKQRRNPLLSFCGELFPLPNDEAEAKATELPVVVRRKISVQIQLDPET
jgi:hypothetical protein